MLIPFGALIKYPKNINGIIHIGAHELEELKFYLDKKIDQVIWIEANPEKYDFIEKNIRPYKDMVLGKFAAGSIVNRSKLNIANNGQSSSILEFGTHKESYPHIRYTKKTEIEIIPLDQWIEEKSIIRDKYNFLNIDIQGYELEALKGSIKQLSFVDYVYLEVNFRQVYENCSELKDIDDFMNKFKFKRVGIFKTNKGWGDAIYAKKLITLSRLYYYFLIPLLKIYNFPFKVFRVLKNELIKNIN